MLLTWGQNDYSWCNSNFQVSGWDQKVKNFTGYGIPILYVKAVGPFERRSLHTPGVRQKGRN